eukprot:CAMPEP_0119475328 /NCGR_PEP_ID=MMETSP1344-20130328/6257_1 /TAXON_ID=236787 /ORGANISM="Florenciella parvula, Strain CCMP2471" /LENGTH=41 /DNA_ID= /DNA_START= /DNA_END= /DNA_ORIENTATION=
MVTDLTNRLKETEEELQRMQGKAKCAALLEAAGAKMKVGWF